MVCRSLVALGLCAGLLSSVGCNAPAPTEETVESLTTAAETAKVELIEEDSSVADLFNKAVGYAIYPNVVKGALGWSGAMGDGLVFKDEVVTATSVVGHGGLGFGLGGNTYKYVLIFNTDEAYESFLAGKFGFNASATAVAGSNGKSVDGDFFKDVVVISNENAGLIADAEIGLHGFKNKPVE